MTSVSAGFDRKEVMVDAVDKKFKRKFPRRNFERSVGFLYRGEYLVGLGVEIGEGGISFKASKEFAKDTEAVISLQIPGGSFICLRVMVKNIENEGNGATVGCSFLDLKFDHKREVRAYVSARQN